MRRTPGQDRSTSTIMQGLDHTPPRSPSSGTTSARNGPGVWRRDTSTRRQGHDDDRDDDQQHEHGGRDQQVFSSWTIWPFGLRMATAIATGEHHQQRQQQARAQPAPKGFQRNHRSIQLRGNAVPVPACSGQKPVPPSGRQAGRWGRVSLSILGRHHPPFKKGIDIDRAQERPDSGCERCRTAQV